MTRGVFVDLTGRRFGAQVALYRVGSANGQPTWLVRCDCGWERVVPGHALRSGASTRCKKCCKVTDRRCAWCGKRLPADSRQARCCPACSRARDRNGAHPCGKPRRGSYVTMTVEREHVCLECEPWPRPYAACAGCGEPVKWQARCNRCDHLARKRKKNA